MRFTNILLIIAMVIAAVAAQYKPVVLMHGVNSGAKDMNLVKEWIQQALPGIYVVNVEIGNGKLDSIFMTMDEQVEAYTKVVTSDPQLANGFNAIGFSQGSLVTRGYIQRVNNPPVHNYVSWAGPQMGQFGTPFINIKWLDRILGSVPYEKWAQHHISSAQYWKDPYHLEKYLSRSAFLADINNERDQKNQTYADNLSSLNAFVLSYSTVDKTIVPKESGWFGFYANNTQSTIVPLQESQLYLQDFIGLRALDEAGRLHFYSTDCKHGDYNGNACKNYFTLYTLPWLQN
ncbi:palmitoyl-protein thioesterase 3 [Cavenderia fasciculata]|uniref:palmitoyl-protein hydrolase n=1 Tax=Cavenderia fasciculata TaxID=261658 RepID=F4PR94_CACFS|nr:palmitoyl-protein thioesterase 3 [Cavenderia fasciculata]EGG21294.1 palmitoyl-protein thioesterase 3 [Cavenderia fasciculata]|eukprot:XP_004359144.1 palmitoyl-protein thioesterase 3 [Cavenderia fasciculata]